MYLVSGHYRQPLAFSPSELAGRRAARASACATRCGGCSRATPARRTWPSTRTAFFAALANDFNTPTALAALFEWVREANRRGDGVGDARPARDARARSAWTTCARWRRRRCRRQSIRRPRRCCSSASRRAQERDFATADRMRDELRGAAAGRSATGPTGPSCCRSLDVILYGRNPVHEALRGKRAASVARRVGDGARRARAVAGERPAAHRRRRGDRAALRLGCAPGRLRRRGPYPYARAERLLAGAQPLIVALDQIQDPQNLGSICRTAECAGAAGVVIPERRAAEVTPAVCKASAGAVEHLSVARVRNVADFLADARRADCWCYGASGDDERAVAYDAPDYAGSGVVLVLGSEGSGLRPRVAKACDALIALPQHGRIESLGVSAAAAAILYEILQQREKSLDNSP